MANRDYSPLCTRHGVLCHWCGIILVMESFQETVWEYFRHNRRELPWREEPFEPYRILVSEMMLQQTQVPRVIPKYHQFITVFSDMRQLADAGLGEVLRLWSGLGYNRRAKYLHEAAQRLVRLDRQWTMDDLTAVKGIGPNTAAAIITYSYNRPELFIETNIRTVYIHHFFLDQEKVTDKEILGLLTQTLDTENPRDFYYALMDYGSFLKKEVGNLSRSSAHYAKQSAFHGSRRQIRGAVLRLLIAGPQEAEQLKAVIADPRLGEVLRSLSDEQLISEEGGVYRL